MGWRAKGLWASPSWKMLERSQVLGGRKLRFSGLAFFLVAMMLLVAEDMPHIPIATARQSHATLLPSGEPTVAPLWEENGPS